MTYRELIKACYKIPDEKCSPYCKYRKECEAFENKTDVAFPGLLHKILNFDLDKEIEVEENDI